MSPCSRPFRLHQGVQIARGSILGRRCRACGHSGCIKGFQLRGEYPWPQMQGLWKANEVFLSLPSRRLSRKLTSNSGKSLQAITSPLVLALIRLRHHVLTFLPVPAYALCLTESQTPLSQFRLLLPCPAITTSMLPPDWPNLKRD